MADHSNVSPGTPGSEGFNNSSGALGAALNGSSARSVKRPRPVKSCTECRKRKLRCDRLLPCSQCQKSQRGCRYAADGDPANLSDGSDGEAAPERAVKRRNLTTTACGANGDSSSSGILEDHASRLERLEKLLLAKSPPLSDAGSARFHRPAAAPLTIRGLTVKGGLRTRFFGPMSTRVLLNLFDEAKDFMFSRNKPGDIRELFINIQKLHRTLQDEHNKAITPITVFVDSLNPIQKRMADVLPAKHVCDQLLQVYLRGSETIYRAIHIPSFMNQYNLYWEGHLQPDVFLPQLLSILCIGYRFLGTGKGLFPDREGLHIPTASTLVRGWLDNLRGKQLIEFSTLQAEVLQLCAQRMINPQNHESWTHLGLIVRMAMTMGLHRDPSEFSQKISPFWAEQRRKLWYTILEMDIGTSLMCNLPCSVRPGDFTCQPPRNIDDADISPETEELPESKPIDQHTDCRIQVYAASTIVTRFKVIDLVNRIDTLRDYQPVLELGTELERYFEDLKYVVPAIPTPDPTEARSQWMDRVVLDMHCRRPILALYRPFALGVSDCPQPIMTAYLRSSIILLSYLDDMDQTAAYYQRAWHMHYLVLKQDILMAAFSVCYYIKHLSSEIQSPQSSGWGGSTRSDSIEEACALASESSALLAPSRLRKAVEQALDNNIRRIREIGTDMKDLITLTVVLSTCSGGTSEKKMDNIKTGMQKIIDAGMASIHNNQDNVPSIPVISPTAQGVNPLAPNPDTIDQSIQPFMMTPDIPNVIPDDFSMWDMEFWHPLLQAPST